VLLVVLVLGVGLLLPALVSLQDEAAKRKCVANLRQLGVALGGYHDTHEHFPQGTFPHPDLPPEKRLSWIVAVHPYIESIRAKPVTWAAWDAEGNRDVACFLPEFLHCPLNGDGMEDAYDLTSYVGVAGSGQNAANLPLSSRHAGVFGYDRRASLGHFRRGRSNTLMVLETDRENGPRAAGGPATVRGVAPDGRPPAYAGGPFTSPHRAGIPGPSSRPWLTHALLADGSVRALTEDADPKALAALATLACEKELPWPGGE
jgi:hypothetical protein